jgi:tRNA modification GTPase
LSPSSDQYEARKIYYGWISSPESKIDNVLAWVAYGPHSFTGEDAVEISCHGGRVVIGAIVEELIRVGARLADPGEFTKRAFLNGKIDLMQAEATIDLINAKTMMALKSANAQLDGSLSKAVAEIREKLINVLAAIEASADFPDEIEGGVGLDEVRSISIEIEKLLESADQGRILRMGARVAILGKPNAGKSSLLNALLDNDRAIVTDAPGTTRDTIEEMASVGGIPVIYIDTAGMRKAGSRAEELGIERTKKEIERADIVINLFDGTGDEISTEEIETARILKNKNVIPVINKTDILDKIDLEKVYNKKEIIKISALKKMGIGKIKEEIVLRLSINEGSAENGFINERQKAALEKAKESLVLVLSGFSERVPVDLLSIDFRAAIVHLGELTGEEVSGEVIDRIFSRFCVGK